MNKKLLATLCCFAPLGSAFAEQINITQQYYDNDFDGNLTAGNVYVVGDAEAGDVLSGTAGGMAVNDVELGTGGIEVGTSGASTSDEIGGWLYILENYFTTNNRNRFTLNASGTVSLGGVIVKSGYEFYLTGSGSNSATIGGEIITDGTFSASNFDSLTINGALNANVGTGTALGGNIDLRAGTIKMAGATIAGAGSVNIAANTTLSIDGDLQFTGPAAGKYNISGGNISVVTGSIQNQSAGDVTITSTGDLLVSDGSIQNMGYQSGGVTTGGNMTITANNITAQYISNGYEGSDLTVTAGGNLTLNGATDNGSSLELNGKSIINVAGTARLGNGWTLINGGNTFSLTARVLDISGVTDAAKLKAMFTNTWDSYALNITGDGLNIADTDITNNDGDMTIVAQSITAHDIYSNSTNGKMVLTANNGNVTVNDIVSATDSDTTISASGTLTANNVNNSGDMTLGAASVELVNVTNNKDASLHIHGYNNDNGTVSVSNDIVNNGKLLEIMASNINIGGTLSANAGTTLIQGNGTTAGLSAQNIVVGGGEVGGGVLNVNSIGGGVTVGNQAAKTGSLLVKSGALNFDSETVQVTVYGEDGVTINGNVTVGGDAAAAGGDVNIAASEFTMTAENGAINVVGGISANTSSYTTFIADDISVGGEIYAGNSAHMTFGNAATAQKTGTQLTVATGALNTVGSGVIDIYHDKVRAGSVVGGGIFNLYGTTLNAGWVNVTGGLWFGGNESTKPQTGIFLNPAGGKFTLVADQAGEGSTGVRVAGSMSVGAGNSLTIDSVEDIVVGGATVINGNVYQGANGTETLNLVRGGNFTVGGLSILGDFIAAENTVNYTGTNGVNITGTTTVNDGAVANITSNAGAITAKSINVNGGELSMTAKADSISVTDITVADGGVFDLTAAKTITGAAVNVAKGGSLSLTSNDGNVLTTVTNAGTLTLDSGNGFTDVATFENTATGVVTLTGLGLNVTAGDFTTPGILRQNFMGELNGGDVNVATDTYSIKANNTVLKGIIQESGTLNLFTNTLTVNGDIGVAGRSGDVNVVAINESDLLTVSVKGNVYGGVDFMGVKSMNITGNYVFDDNSRLNAWINPDESASYWATVNTTEGLDYGKITNKGNQALITVGGQFITDLNLFDSKYQLADMPDAPGALGEPRIGINITSMIDQGDAIWLLHATGINGQDSGNPIEELKDKIRNLYVQFCNYNGTICYNYFDSFNKTGSLNADDLPAYISMRDTDDDGIADSLYIVFDPDFGGPVEVFKIQPIVDAQPSHTEGEYASAGALDDLIAGKLLQTGFFNRTPIEVIPLVFRGTNMETLMNELYDRMEYYVLKHDGEPLARFSRLIQPREVEQLAGSVVLNEHTTFRDFEDRMFDEFIWNRHRNLKKAWVDVDFGWFNQSVTDGKRVTGNRFSVAGGFDWQESDTLILGLTAHVSHMSGDNSDTIDLSYNNITQMGRVDVSVADTNIGLGGYLMKNLGTKSRVYGNAFLDFHLLDVSRDMTFMAAIDGSGTAVSLITEWGLLHDWLNQYVVGNLYARLGYNFGFSVTERAGGQDYMKMESDGYMILTPGYSLIAQKRIYPSAWLQIRPYASVGVEYDVLGAPDTVKYKFAAARRFTDYDVEIDPLWANIGGGVEVLSATGIQVGLDYRYQYNQDIQLHKIRLSGSYRF